MNRPRCPDPDLPPTGSETLANAHKLCEPWLPFLWIEIIVFLYFTRFLRGVNGWKHITVIYQLGSSRKCQSCYDVFVFNQLLIGHIEFICEIPSCLSCVPALLFQQVVHLLVLLVLCQFVHSCTLPCLYSLHPISPLDPCCVPGTKLGSRHEDVRCKSSVLLGLVLKVKGRAKWSSHKGGDT